MLSVTYLHHSGFLVETDQFQLIFDGYSENGTYDFFKEIEEKGKQRVFFVSHAHGDHFDPLILQGQKEDTVYVLSNDIGVKPTGETLFVGAGETHIFHDMGITTLQSNDEGVAFLVTVEGKTIYHGGDLNWWHWNGESDAFNEEIAKSYKKEIEKLKEIPIDVAFVPMDPRLEDKYYLAMDYIMSHVDIEKAFPMHFWGDFTMVEKLQQELFSAPYREKLIEIKKRGQTFSLE